MKLSSTSYKSFKDYSCSNQTDETPNNPFMKLRAVSIVLELCVLINSNLKFLPSIPFYSLSFSTLYSFSSSSIFSLFALLKFSFYLFIEISLYLSLILYPSCSAYLAPLSVNAPYPSSISFLRGHPSGIIFGFLIPCLINKIIKRLEDLLLVLPSIKFFLIETEKSFEVLN